MGVGDLLSITVHGTYKYLKPVLNVFHYYWFAGPHTAEEIAIEFIAKPLFQMRALYYNDMHFEQISVRNLFDPSFGIDYAAGVDGSRPGIAEELPTHDACAIRFRHANPALRGGWKRFGAPCEVDQLDGALEAAFNIYLNNLASAILDNLWPGGGGTETDGLQYCIIKRILVSPGEYRLPENLGEAVWGIVTSAELKPRITTQNSRKWLG